MSSTIKIKRGTRQAITDLAIKGGLSEGEPLLITDEGRMAVATAPTGFSNSAMLSDTFGFKNKIHNGKMEIAQRGTSFAAIVTGAYSLDRWQYATGTTTAVITISQSSDVPISNEFQNSLRCTVTTADTSIAAGDVVFIQQHIEGFNARDLIGRDITISFWVRSSKTGVHCVSLSNSIQDRSYILEYSINAVNTWEKKSVIVKGGLITSGTWNWTTGIGLRLRFALAAGTNFQGTAGSWLSSAALTTSSQVNCLDTVSNIFAITGVQLEVGTVATPFEHRPYGLELSLAQRYYYRIYGSQTGASPGTFAFGFSQSTTAGRAFVNFPQPFRIAPTALEQSGIATDYRVILGSSGSVVCSAVPVFSNGAVNGGDISWSVASGATANQAVLFGFNSSTGFLGWSADL